MAKKQKSSAPRVAGQLPPDLFKTDEGAFGKWIEEGFTFVNLSSDFYDSRRRLLHVNHKPFEQVGEIKGRRTYRAV